MKKLIATTERLLLRELDLADAAFMFRLVNSEGWLRYIGNRNVGSVGEAEAYLQRGAIASYRSNGFGLWAIEERVSGKVTGICGLVKREGLDEVDLGFALDPAFEGKGYALEAATASLEVAARLGFRRLVAITTPDNIPSIRLLQKLGFNFLNNVTLPGSTDQLNMYEILL